MSALFMYDVSYAVMFYAEINLSIYLLFRTCSAIGRNRLCTLERVVVKMSMEQIIER